MMVTTTLLVCVVLFVSYSNGANDNFKGVATLYGANVTNYKTALTLATAATFAGCAASLFLAAGLTQAFSGKGLVPDSLVSSQPFMLAVASGAGATVMLATVLGLPISTTHGLTGALAGAGLMAVGDKLNLSILGGIFFLPLLVSPLVAIAITVPAYKIAHAACKKLRVTRHSCICLAPGNFIPVADFANACGNIHSAGAPDMVTFPTVVTGNTPECMTKYGGHVLGLSAQSIVDHVHYLSAAAVCFGRGLNDTPKIVALLLMAKGLDADSGMVAVATAMAIGGLLNARRVAETMSRRISKMNDGQALTANMVTAFMVIFASRLSLPVSTTHVSVGAITGIGLVNGSAETGMIATILLSWVLTLPVAFVIGATAYWLQTQL
jgi:PiT family inorganic phosphate transporter